MIGNIIKQKGLTLVEVLIVLAIFSITALLAINILLNYLKIENQLLAKQSLENNLRFTLESLARDIRESRIDYDYYVDQGILLVDVVDELALRDQENSQIIYEADEFVPGQYSLLKNNELVHSPDIYLTQVKFHVRPEESPWGLAVGTGTIYNTQPVVMILLTGVSETKKGDIYEVDLQTTITSRYYGR